MASSPEYTLQGDTNTISCLFARFGHNRRRENVQRAPQILFTGLVEYTPCATPRHSCNRWQVIEIRQIRGSHGGRDSLNCTTSCAAGRCSTKLSCFGVTLRLAIKRQGSLVCSAVVAERVGPRGIRGICISSPDFARPCRFLKANPTLLCSSSGCMKHYTALQKLSPAWQTGLGRPIRVTGVRDALQCTPWAPHVVMTRVHVVFIFPQRQNPSHALIL